ncbi:MAG TPA: sulfatase-like hydrolase/transferase [Candidatus Hydrogenedentes bacterium]|nr:sulfatase-like hydrolase/transferase [Candidatus Hydrogenedentota bacterium]
MSQVSRRDFVKTAAAGLALGGCSTTGAGADRETHRPPNLVFVFPDEFRRQAIGCMGEDPVITPNLDRFASEGVVFTHAVSNRPVCSPYRASLLTGKYPFSTGVTTNCYDETVPYNVFLRESERCISDVLHDRGYCCGYIGKWHLEAPREPHLYSRGKGGVWDEYTPPGPRRHGFEFWHSYGCHDDHLHPHYWIGDAPRDKETTFDEWSPRHEASTAIEFIRNRDERPFALFVSMNPPHMPFHMVPDEYVDRYGDKTCEDLLTRPNVDLNTKPGQIAKRWAKHYFAAVTGVDEQFGRILQCLKDEGLENDTIVVFTSDHGEMMGSQGLMYKSVWYEESLGVPFLIRWPGRMRPGRDDLLLGVPDVMPTLLGLMGLGKEIPAAVEGTNYAPLLLGMGGKRPSSALYLLHDPATPDAGARGIRTSRYTYVIERRTGGGERFLYDNEKDPYQRTNKAGSDPALEKELQAELARWLELTRDPWRNTLA